MTPGGLAMATCEHKSSAQRPNPDTGTSFRSRFAVQGTRKLAKAKPAPTDPPPITELLAQAEAWQRELDEGAVKSRAAIAARPSSPASCRSTAGTGVLG